MGNKGFKSPWGKATTIAVVVFVVLFMLASFLFSKNAEANESTMFEGSISTTFVGGERYGSESFIYTENINDKYRAGMLLQIRLECLDGSVCKRGESVRSNQAVFIQRYIPYKACEINLGVSYWNNETPSWNSHTPFMLGGKCYLGDWILGYTHFSTGGSSTNNGGMDLITFGVRF